MMDLTTLLLLCPFLIPLVSAGIVWFWPSHNTISTGRHRFYLSSLLLTCAALVVLGILPTQTVTWSLGRATVWYNDLLEFSSSMLSLSLTGLFTASWVVLAIGGWRLPLGRREVTYVLLLVSAVNASLFSANLLTLCVTWALLDLTLLAWQVYQVRERDLTVILRRMAGNLASTILLLAAAALVTAVYRQSHYGYFTATGSALYLLMLAALLRIGTFPFPTSLKYRWEILLIALCTGGFLWLQITNMLPQTPRGNWWIALGTCSLLVTAMLAALSKDLTEAWPYVFLHGTALLLLAPLIGGAAGAGISLLVLIGLGISLTIMRLDALLEPIPPLGRLVRLPLIVALATLCGWPLTVGLISRWAFLEIAWEVGYRSLFAWTILSFLLSSVPIWRQLRQVRYRMRRPNAVLPHPEWQFGAAVALLLAAVLVIGGLWPDLLSRIWSHRTFSISIPAWGDLWLVSPRLLGLLIASLLIGPLLGSYLLSRALNGGIGESDAFTQNAIAYLRLEWAYRWLERLSMVTRRMLRRVMRIIQESFYLGWVLAWALLLVLYFAER